MSPTGNLLASRIAWLLFVCGTMAGFGGLFVMCRNDPVGIVILDQLGPGYRAYWVLLLGMSVSLAISIVLRRRVLFARQQKNELAAARLLENLRADQPAGCKEFFVYLRSFETTGHLKPPFFFTLAVLQRLHTNELESFLALALEKKGPVVALGLPGEEVGAARIRVMDTTWKADIQRLLTHATGLLVLPSAHEGTMWEIEFIQKENLLQKSVFVMPPKTRQFNWRTRWEQAAQALRQFSITLPEYNERGLLFSLNAAGEVADARVFSLLYRRSIRKSIEEMLAGVRKTASGVEAIRKANRRSRVIWLYGKWITATSSLILSPILLLFGMSGVWSGRAPRGVNPPPAWFTFLFRYDSAQEVSSGQSLLDSEILFLNHSWLPETQIDRLAKKGLTRVGDIEREIYLLGWGELLSHAPNEGVCAALADGRASELERTRTLVTLPSPHVKLWLNAREQAARAALQNRPVLVRDGALEPDLNKAISEVLGETAASGLRDVILARRKLTDRETCMLGIVGGAALYRLREPYRARLATVLAERPPG